ncbi:PREDICTED: uncharacterized protein LOC106810027 [Priapulus caudatus]|uniref:Uncharacterized protein LOC106810027 n=1 Tax=Priapulus caudatus TaxID=37621 RepID=A0ABM1E991_PRICU|nr:PREDICTED: uncharacterized protein LOC106810027 [Priapulus caudatus]
MSSGKRLAKRSILGSRVCVQCDDGHFYPGIIQATKTKASGEEHYSVRLDSRRTVEGRNRDIVGVGFQTVTSVQLQEGQRVFITLTGREVPGSVIRHDANDEVTVTTHGSSSDGVTAQTVVRRIQEVRLLESRKSARLMDLDTDYSFMADPVLAEKRRAISNNIDVPLNPR